jgi:glycosyltransferase involved in cell wall biosynthesis
MIAADHESIRTRARLPAGTQLRVSAVIPTLNEAANLPHVFSRVPDCVDEVVIVDGHSSDDTVAVAKALLPNVRIVIQTGRGKGDALACGFAAARGDIIVMLDADGSTDPAEIPIYLQALLAGADFAKGSRFVEGGDTVDITLFRSFGNRVLNGVVNVLYRTQYTDLCYGYNAFWTDVLPMIDVTCDGFEVEALMNVRAVKAGLTVAEVPSIEYERLHGVSKLHPIRDGIRVLRTIVGERFRPVHVKLASPTEFSDELGDDERLSELSAALQHPADGGPSISIVS